MRPVPLGAILPAAASTGAALLAQAPAAAATGAWAVVPAVALALGGVILLARRSAVRPTTLTGAWGWTVAALAAWGGVELAACLTSAGQGSVWLAPLRLTAQALSFCPIVSVVGAKRPQHAAWNFVVLSLWGITALPAMEAFFLARGPRLEMGDARAWFLWILVALTPMNYAATRYWLGSLLVAAGQVVALSPYLALMERPLTAWPAGVGLLLCTLGMVAAWIAARKPTAAASPYDRAWRDFRDTFGLLWALRVQERVNAAARQYGWDLELGWSGFLRASDGTPLAAIDPAIEPALRTTFKGLLRRFVANEWIAQRLDRDLPLKAPPF